MKSSHNSYSIHYCPKCGAKLKLNQIVCPHCCYCHFTDKLSSNATKMTTFLSAEQLETNTQWLKYHCGKDGICGHGYAAEDLNNAYDKLRGHNVVPSGRDNSQYGPDRTVDGVQIQTKYCRTPYRTVNAAFPQENGGDYAYLDTNTGKPQLLEVPYDQYEECVELMRKKIAEGHVKDRDGNLITDINEAENIVKRGAYTQKQAENITKAGNIDSLKFDMETGAVVALSAFGISFAINLGLSIIFRDRNELSTSEAIDLAFLTGLKNGTISMSSHILTTQVLKTSFGRNLASLTTHQTKQIVDNIWSTKFGKDLLQKLAQNVLKKDVYGGAARQVVIKYLRTNAIGHASMMIISALPDTVSLIRGKISKPEYISNLITSGSSIVGMTIGAVLGSKYGPFASFAGGMAGGEAFGWVSKKITHVFHKSDSEKMQKIIKIVLVELANDYLIQTQEEFDQCILAIQSEGAINTDLLRCMYAAGKDSDDDFLRAKIAYSALEYYFDAVIRMRKPIKLKNNQRTILEHIEKIGEYLN